MHGKTSGLQKCNIKLLKCTYHSIGAKSIVTYFCDVILGHIDKGKLHLYLLSTHNCIYYMKVNANEVFPYQYYVD